MSAHSASQRLRFSEISDSGSVAGSFAGFAAQDDSGSGVES